MKIEYPKISIITPSYNQGEYIEQTILSILNQNYPNLEYIIIDGGSTDCTVEIIKKYDASITYWVSEKDRGQSHAINKGLLIASGDIINWLNSDDYYEPGSLFKVAEAFQKTQKIHAILGRTRIVGGEYEQISKTEYRENDPFFNFSKARIDQPSTFFSKEFYSKIKELNEDLHLAMDLDLWLKFLLYYKNENIFEINSILANFREHKDSKTVNFRKKMVVERASLLNEVVKKYDQNKGCYSNIITTFDRSIEKLIIKGCSDFQMYWYKQFKSSNPELAKQLKNIINTKYLNLKDKLYLLLR